MTDWRSRVSNIKEGDTICFKASFCRSIGAYTGDLPFARGIVTKILRPDSDSATAVIKWLNYEGMEKILLCNLSKVTEKGIADE